jgi:hypothetical protein
VAGKNVIFYARAAKYSRLNAEKEDYFLRLSDYAIMIREIVIA